MSDLYLTWPLMCGHHALGARDLDPGCLGPPYVWWQWYKCSPYEWLSSPPSRWMVLSRRGLSVTGRSEGHGHCTHRNLLKDAMRVVERRWDEQILASLADI